MGRLPVCFYGEEDPKEALKRFYEGIRALTERGIDGHNISGNLLGDGLVFDEPTDPRVTPRKIVNELADTTSNCYTRCKTDGLEPATEYGLETFVKASNATYGKWCLGDVDDPDKQQILSLSTDVYTAADPGSTIKANLGHLTLDTLSSSFNIITNDKTIRSTTTNTADIGTSSIGFKELYIRTIDTDGAQSLLLQRNNVTQLTLDGTTVTAAVKVVSTQLESTVATGTAPFVAASTTKVTNLNTDLLDDFSIDSIQHWEGSSTISITDLEVASTTGSVTIFPGEVIGFEVNALVLDITEVWTDSGTIISLTVSIGTDANNTRFLGAQEILNEGTGKQHYPITADMLTAATDVKAYFTAIGDNLDGLDSGGLIVNLKVTRVT